MLRPLAALSCLLPLACFAAAAAEPTRAQLEARLHDLQTALAGNVCDDPASARAVLDGAAASGTKASGDGRSGDAAPASGHESAAGPLPRTELVARLKQAVVMVITPQDSGSGFFITPDTLLTNAHVVKDVPADKIALLGPGVGGVRPAKLIARVSGAGLQSRDYALLRISGAPASAALPLSATAADLEPVVAAGFPGLLLVNDIQFQNMLRGKVTGLPDLILSQGSIMAVQNRDSQLPTIAHSAAISAGNSGGPLVDACGRAVGVNTFIRVAVDQASHAGYAIAAGDIIRFLRENGVSPTVESAPCR